MATIYRNSENKYTARKLIFGNDVSPYCYHDFALTKKMTADELRDAFYNGALYIDVMSNDRCSDLTPPNRFLNYDTISKLYGNEGSYSYITIRGASSESNIIRYSAEYTA